MADEWLNWAKKLEAIAQIGLTFSKSPYDLENYTAIREIAAEMFAANSELEKSEIIKLMASYIGYATPKIDVRGALFKGDTILLVQEKIDQRWSLPGGWADINDSAGESVVREIREEAGLIAKAVKLIAFFDKHKHNHPPDILHAYKSFFLCEYISGELKTNHETLDAGFFALDELPPLSLPRVTEEEIRTCYKHYKNVGLPTEFD